MGAVTTRADRDGELAQRRWNATSISYPAHSSISEQFALRVAERPDAVALRDGPRRTSYAALAAASDVLATRLRRLGVGPDRVVAICVPRSDTLVLAQLGILKAGGAYLVLDPDEPTQRLATMLEDANAAAFVAPGGGGVLRDLTSASRPLVDAGTLWAYKLLDTAGRRSSASSIDDALTGVSVSSRHLAYVTYTSGSTGRAKPVMIEHRSVLRLLFGVSYVDLGPERVILHASAPTFDASTFEIWAPLLHGGTCVIQRDHPTVLPILAQTIRQGRVDTAWLTSSLFNMIVDTQPEVLSGVSQLLVGGEALSVAHVRAFRSLSPDTRLVNGYGPTETTTFACCHQIARHLAPDQSIPIGSPIANTTAWVLRPSGSPAPVGEAGELSIGGDGVARGYLGRSALSAEKFVPDPFAGVNGARMYASGDVARWLPEGVLEFLGRRDGQVKIRGHRVEPSEIEDALRRLPDVRDAAVVARDSPAWGRQLVAYVVLAPSSSRHADDLRKDLRLVLPERLLPAVVVALPRLPLTVNGKLDRTALPAAVGRRPDLATSYQPPATPSERLVTEVLAQLLELDRVGVDDDVFQLGADSLITAAALHRIAERSDIELNPRSFFDHSTARLLAAQLQSAGTACASVGPPPVTPGSGMRLGPLSRAQEAIAHVVAADPATASAYTLSTEVTAALRLEPGLLQQAFALVQERQESLRTVVEHSPGAGWAARVLDTGAAPVPIEVIDLAHLDSNSQARAVEDLRRRDVRDPLLLTGALPIRAQIVRQASERSLLRVAAHHVLFDGWSVGLLLNEIGAAYARIAGQDDVPEVAKLLVQYRDYVRWQQQWPIEDVTAWEMAYWSRTLAGSQPVDVPGDRPPTGDPSGRGGMVGRSAPPGAGPALRQLGAQLGATLFSTLAAAFFILLQAYTRRDDLAVSTPVAGRPRPELSDVIGCFYNSILIRTDLTGDPPFTRVVERVRDSTHAAADHEQTAFRDVMAAVALERPDQVKLGVQDRRSLGLQRPIPAWLDRGTTWVHSDASTRRDLHLHVWDIADPLQMVLRYSRDRFDSGTALRILDHYVEVLARALRDPSARVSLLTEGLHAT